MATYDLAYPGAAIDAILNTAYFLQEAGYIFQGSASEYSGTPSKRVWLIAPAGFTGLGLSSAVPQGSIGICLYNGTAWVGKVINVLTLDSAPTRNSQNGVTSGGVAATLDEIAGGIMETFASLLFDDETASADLRTKLSYAVKFSVSDVYQTVTHLNILAATTSKAGLLSAEDKVKIDSFLTNLRSLTFADTTASADQGTKITETLKATIGGVQEVIDSITLLAATSSKAGLLSASDKAYIDALPATLTSLSNSISGALALMQSMMGYYVCDTAAGTAAKTVAATGYSLTNGGCIRIKMTNANTAGNATLNINSTGAKALYYDGTQASSTNTWEAGEVLEVYYDGTQYQCASGGGGKFATGQKVKEVSIDNELDETSDGLPTNEAVSQAIEDDEYVIAKAMTLLENKVDSDELINDEEVIARAVGNHETRIKSLEDGGGGSGGGGSSLSGIVTKDVSDTICVIGSSFGIGYTIAGKHWVNIVDMFSDYAIQNLSADGSSNLTRLIALRGSGINPAKKAKYALLVNSENLGGNTNVVYQSFVNLAKVIMSYGITPVCGTSYRNISGFRQYNQYFSSLLRKFCKDNNTLFMDAAEYCTVVGQGYNFERPGNTHLGTRQIPLVAYAYMDALHGLERPYQSIKTFTKRDEVTVNSLDDLMFSDNYGRAKVFKLSNTFADYALISAVLPATARNLKTLKLSFVTNDEVEVYVINTNAQPYPTVNNYTRFHVDSTITVPSVGATYSYNSTTFTVVHVETDNPYGAYCDIYCSPSLQTAAEVSGILTKVSGSGSDSIPFTSYGIATLDSSVAVMSDTIGHWELVEADEDGMYSITNPIGRVFIDKVHFLVKHLGSFSLSGASVTWSADQLKNILRTPVPDFYANSWIKNEELVTEPTFGAIGTTQTSWIDENGDAVVSQSNYEYTLTGSSYLPSGCASIAKVGTTKSIQTTVSNSGFRRNCKVMLEVIARCFGNGFVNGVDTVTSDTFDWGNLLVTIGYDQNVNYNNTFKCPVGLMWKIVRIPIDIVAQNNPYGINDMTLKINADRDGFEVAKVSLKLIDYEVY